MTSPDGITWTLKGAADDTQQWTSVTYGNGLFVAVANSGTGTRVMTSSDGSNWTSRNSAADNLWTSVTYGNGLYVAVSSDGTNRVMTSANGTDWTARAASIANSWRSVTYGNGLFVAVASSGTNTRVMTSDNGTNWTTRTSAADNSWLSITYASDLFVAVASGSPNGNDRVMTSGSVICGGGIPLTTGTGTNALWQQLALPCVPSSANTVAAVFGSGSGSNLTTGNYGTPNPVAGTGWIIQRREVGDTPAYVNLLASEAFNANLGYWIKSYEAPTDGKLSISSGTATPVNTSGDCASASGCAVIPVTTPGAVNRYNLVPNPFPYAVDWSKVRVRVTANSITTVYSPCQAAGISAELGCTGPAAAPASPTVLSNQISIWNGTGYVYPTDLAPSKGNLQYFKSFWVKVLPGANGQTIELLIPAEASTISMRQANDLPWYLAWLDWLAPPAAAETAPIAAAANPQGLPHPGDWYVRLKLDNHVTGWKSYSNLLGQMAGTQAGFDLRDLDAMAPFAKPYLTLVFPHPEWGDKAGDYSADFRPPSPRGQPVDWLFEVRADPVNNGVFLSWDGDPAILKRSRLIDVRTGKTINVSAAKWAKKGYPIQAKGTVERYIWRYLGR